MVLSTFPVFVFAEGGLTYTMDNGGELSYVVDDSGVVITGYNESNATNTECEVPNVIDEKPVYSIGRFAFNQSNVSKVVLPKNIKRVERGAFDNCDNITDFIINSDNVDYFYSSSFYFDGIATRKELLNFTAPICLDYSSVSFYNLFHMYHYISLHFTKGETGKWNTSGVPAWETIKSQGEDTYIKSVIFDDGVQEIGDGAFEYEYELEDVVLPTTLTKIGDGAFAYCLQLKEVAIPNGVTYIGNSAFLGCSNLSEINLPSDCKTLKAWALNASNLTNSIRYKSDGVPCDNHYYAHASNGLKSLIDSASLYINVPNVAQSSIPVGNADMIDETVVLGEDFNTIDNFYTYKDVLGSGNPCGQIVVLNQDFNSSLSKYRYMNDITNKVYCFDIKSQLAYEDMMSREEYFSSFFGSDYDYEKEMGLDYTDVPSTNERVWLKVVTYDANGGMYSNGDTESLTYYIQGEEIELPEKPSRYGYNCLGFSYAPNRTDVVEDGFAVNHNYRLYAAWELKDASVVVNYIDTEGNPVAESKTIEGKVFDEYTAPYVHLDGYYLTEVPDNVTGTMTEDVITVNYVYNLYNGKVTVKYTDTTKASETKPLCEDVTINQEFDLEKIGTKVIETEGKCDDSWDDKQHGEYVLELANNYFSFIDWETQEQDHYLFETLEALSTYLSAGKPSPNYETEAKQFKGYDLVATPNNASGQFKKTPIVVEYKYVLKDASVIVNYIDTDNNKLADSEEINGKVFDEYTTMAKDIDGYELTEAPSNATGTMTEDTITVNYIYSLKNTSVIVNYIDESGKTLAESKTITGKVFDEYTTEAESIEGYSLKEQPENATGVMTVDAIVVNYVYSAIEVPCKETDEPETPKQPTPQEETTIPDEEEVEKETTTEVSEDATKSNKSQEVVRTGDKLTYRIFIVYAILILLAACCLVIINKKINNEHQISFIDSEYVDEDKE